MPLTSPGNDDGTGENHQPTLRKNTAEPVEQTLKQNIVAGDGAWWIDSCVHEWCPNAERAPDGFHIVSWTSDAPDKVRRHPWNQARRDGDEKSVKRMRGVRYTVLKNPGKLTDRRSEASGNLRDTDPKGRPYRS